MSRVDEIIALAEHVPPFPKVAQQVMKMIEDENNTANDIAKVIKYDATITANILKACNSAYFCLSRKVTSLEDALVVMGQDMLKDLIITSSSAKFYSGNAGEGYMLAEGDLWKHGVAVAIMAKSLVRFFEGVEVGAAFTAGLLHDIGKRFISSFVKDDLKKMMIMAHDGKSSFIVAEKEILGISHAELGAMILQKWDFDAEMIEAVRLHHDEFALEKGGLIAVVALANTLVLSMGVGGGADGLASPLRGEYLKRFGIKYDELELVMSELLFELEKAEEMITLVK